MEKLRFKDENGNDYQEWEEKTLSDIGTLKNGYAFESNTYIKDGSDGYNVITISNVTGNRYIEITDKTNKVKEIPKDIRPHQVLKKGDILISLTGNAGRVSINNQDNCLLNQRVGLFDVTSSTVSKNYATQCISNDNFRSAMERQGQGGGQKNISKSDVESFNIMLPCKAEQQKIGNFLSSYDERITLQENKLESLKQQKKGMLQKIFSQEIRFKDDDGNDFPEWEEKTIQELLKYEQPNKYIVSSEKYNNKYNTPVLTAGQSFILGYTNEEKGIYQASNENPVIIFDDFTTSFHLVNFPFKVKSSAMKILTSLNDDTVFLFVYNAMQAIKYKPISHSRQWISEYSKILISVPCKSEQQKIADFFSALDEKINLEEKKLESMRLTKKGLFQQMF